MIKIILYDLDGVLIDACEIHYLSLNRALKEISNTVIGRNEHETVFNGLPTKTKLEMLRSQGRIQQKDFDAIWKAKQDYTKETIEQALKSDFEKIQLHVATGQAGIRSICVTNSITETATLMLEKTGQLIFMDSVFSNEMVKNPKPHGEGYIRAMIKYNSMPEQTLIVEDSEKGIQAAKSTGAHVLVVSDPSKVTKENVFKKLEEINGI